MPPKPDLVFNNAPTDVETDHPAFNVKLSPTKPGNDLYVVPTAVLTQSKLVSINDVRPVSTAVPKTSVTRPRHDKTIVTKPNSPPRRHINRSPSPKASTFPPKVTAVKALMGNPKHVLKDKRVIDSGCLRHMIRNMSYLSDFKELNGGYVSFGGNPKGGKISGKGKIRTGKLDFDDVYFVKELKFNLFSVSQMCDKKNNVLFTDTECLVLSLEFKLPDENQVLLRVPKENNMYNVNLKNIVPSGDLTFLFAKPTLDESNLWHRRLGHINFKTMNKLVKGNLVRGLPSKVFKNNNICVACNKGKQHRASCKIKPFCGMKRIKREFSLPRTPQQNGIAERKNRNLIEAARTMLADSLLPIPFWAEAVNTACYVQNRVLVTKPQNKTPYELLHGRTPSISFMRPFGCLVTILNTFDSLGKFDRKVDEGFLVGYSVSSKAFRVFNSRTRIVQETLHVNFLENKPNVVGSGPTWLFDIDILTKTMNYQPVTAGNQSNPSAGVQEQFDAEKAGEEIIQQYVLFPVWSSGSTNPQNTDGDAAFDEKKPEYEVNVSPSSKFEDFSDNSINEDNAACTLVPAFGQLSPNNTNTFSAAELEDITYSDDEDDVSAKADFNNLETSITVSPIPTTSVHKDHRVTQIIGDLSLATQTRSMTKVAKDQGGRNCYEQVFAPVVRIEAIRLFLAYASFMGFMVHQMDVKSAFLYRTIEEEALYGLHQAPRAWYETLANYLLENGFQRGKIDQTLFIKRQKGDIMLVQIYVDDIIFVKQKKDGIFISQDKYVAEILRKFGLTDRKSANTPIDTEKPLLKDPNDLLTKAFDVGRFQYLVARQTTTGKEISNSFMAGVNTPRCDEDRLELMKLTVFLLPSDEKVRIEVSAVDLQVNDVMRLQALVDKKKVIITKATLRDALRLDDAEGIECLTNEEIFAELARMGYEKTSTKLTFYKAFFSSQWKFLIHTILQCMSAKRTSWNEFSSSMASAVTCLSTVGDLSLHTNKYSSPTLNQKVFANMRRVEKGFSGVETPLFEGMIVEQPVDEGNAEVNVEDVSTAGVAAEGDVSAADDRLERRNKASKLQRLKKVGTTQRIETSDDTVMDDVSEHGRMIADVDADVDVIMDDAKEVAVEKSADVLSMQDDQVEPAELQEVMEVVTTAKLITEVVTAASTTITAAASQLTISAAPTLTTAPSAARRRKWSKEPKPLKKQAQIKQDEAYARELEAKLNKNIDCDETEAQARKNMMIYLRNVAGFKMDYFKGMTYDDICLIFEKHFNSNVAFLLKTKEQMDEEDSRALKRLSKSQEDKAAKKQKVDEEVEELRKHLMIVPNKEDDVYTEATTLARKVPVVDYKIYNENNKPYYKIKRADARYTSLNLEKSKKCSWSSEGQELEAVRVPWCADYDIHYNTVDFAGKEKVMHFVARSLSSAPSAVLRRCSDSHDMRNEEAELKPKVWITIVIKSVESIPKDLESVEKKLGTNSEVGGYSLDNYFFDSWCGDSLDDVFCQRCTCESCGNGAHIGYNCPPKVLIISNLEPCHNQNVDEFPQTLPSFHPTCYFGDDNSFAYDSTPNFVDDSPNVFNPPPQPPTYSYEFCGNDAHYSHDCPLQVLFIYNPEPVDSKLFNDVENIHEELAKYIYTPSWNRPAFYNYDDDDDEDYIIAITPVLLIEEPVDSLIMEDEHLDTISTTELNEVIKSSVEDLFPILNQFEDFSDSNDDSTSIDDDSFSIDEIDYVEASPPHFELVSLGEVKDFHLEDREIEDDIIRENLLKINLLISKIESLNDNPTPDHVLNDHTKETSSGSTTIHADNSLPNYDSFLFEIEPDQGELTSVVMKDILGEPRFHVPNVLPTHPTLMLDSDFIPSDNYLPEYEIFYFDIEEKNSDSTTIYADISLSDLKCFYLRVSLIRDSLDLEDSFSWFCPSITRSSHPQLQFGNLIS
nr:ribonuclease H-like domain-containing protein [Tanacetum cinerariifolium]